MPWLLKTEYSQIIIASNLSKLIKVFRLIIEIFLYEYHKISDQTGHADGCLHIYPNDLKFSDK